MLLGTDDGLLELIGGRVCGTLVIGGLGDSGRDRLGGWKNRLVFRNAVLSPKHLLWPLKWSILDDLTEHLAVRRL